MKTASIKVEHIDHMGTDLTVVNAARVSFDKQSEWCLQDYYPTGFESEPATRKVLSEADTKLIAYLAKHNHWSPFAHTSIQLRVKAPIFVARQLVKHCVGGVWNEVSRRYVDSEPEFYFPEVWRGRPTDGAKQGSSGVVTHVHGAHVSHGAQYAANTALNTYNQLIEGGVAPEQARMILPQNMMTEWSIYFSNKQWIIRTMVQYIIAYAK